MILLKNDSSKAIDITPIANNPSWESSFSITVSLEFEIGRSKARLFPINPCEIGDVVILEKNNEEVYRGLIIEEQFSGRSAIKYVSYDYSWYLSQSTSVYQFNGIPASRAISKILTDFGIKIGSMINMPTKIDQIFIEKTPGSIIQTIIEKVQQHEGYYINAEMRKGKIYFEKRQDLLIQGTFHLAEGLEDNNTIHAISDPQRTRSLEPMRNRIRLIVDDEQNEYQITAVSEDREKIQQYGLIEETLKIDAEDAAKSRQVARILLRRLSKIHETNKASFMGDIRFKAGRLFDLAEPVTGINNRLIITQANHKVEGQDHRMDLELALPSEVN